MKRELGVCYYPEHWPETLWQADAERIRDSGITWVRIGEFGWSKIEPAPGTFDFDWLDRAIDVLASEDLKVILGTPSCTPPRWMQERFPDMFARDAQGQVRKFGSRRHYCFSHRGYRGAAAAMAQTLGERYGCDARIHAWQIDNEYGCHDTILSYSDAAREAFQAWLAKRYGTIEHLNTAWGNVFWSMEYAEFDQVDLPNLTVTQANPSHEWAFRRFSSDQVVDWNAAQVAALRPLTDKPLIHNYMGRVLDFDHFEVGASLDVASWDSYPIGFLSDRLEGTAERKARYLRQGDPDMQAFHHDLYRAVGQNGRWWVMEQQPGPVNWAPFNPAPLPGMVRLWTWEAFAHGAEVVSYFRWRQAPFAQEQMHAGLRRPDDTAAPGLAEAIEVATELSTMPESATVKADVALVFDYASEWAWDVLPQGADFNYFRLMLDAYRALRKQGLSIDILPSTCRDFGDYKLVLAPGIAHMSDDFKNALAKTRAIVGPRSAAVTEDMTIPTPMGPHLPGLSCTVTQVESLPPSACRAVEGGGAVWHWCETLEGGAEITYRYSDGTAFSMQSDTTTYIGGWPDSALWERLVVNAAIQCGLDTEAMPVGVRRRDTSTHSFYFNYGSEPCQLAGKTLPPAGVIWVQR